MATRDRILTLIALTTMVLSAGAAPLAAQTAPGGSVDRTRDVPGPARLVLGLAVGDLGAGQQAMGARLAIALTTAPHRLLTIRATALQEFDLFQRPNESVWDVGLLYGAQQTTARSYVALSAGVALTGGMRRGARLPSRYDESDCYWLAAIACALAGTDYEEDPFITFGLPLEVELGWTPTESFGLALTGYGNLNRGRRTLGASLALVLGRLRSPGESARSRSDP